MLFLGYLAFNCPGIGEKHPTNLQLVALIHPTFFKEKHRVTSIEQREQCPIVYKPLTGNRASVMFVDEDIPMSQTKP